MISSKVVTVLATCFISTQAFFFGGGSSCGCQAPPACPPPPPPAPCGGGGYAQPAYAAPTAFAALPAYPQRAVYARPAPYVAPASYGPPPPQAQPPILTASRGAYVSPVKRHITEDTGVDQSEGYRVKREDEAVFDPKCNSEGLKSIILENIHESTAIAKKQIQSAAADALGGRIDVICSKGTFSYIVNTELYCETEKNGTTCFAFKQSS